MWYFYGMFLNSLKLGTALTFCLPGETGRRVGKGRPACYLRNRLVGENEDPGLSGVPV